MHTVDELVEAGLAAFDTVVKGIPGFRERAGQREMALEVAKTFAVATLGQTMERPVRAISVLQAGTGVGKSAAYAVVGITIARMRKVKLVLSSSSVALQEQLLTKDLPLLAKHMPEPFSYAIAKGRGRYICKLKLAGLTQSGGTGVLDVAEAEGEQLPQTAGRPFAPIQQRIHFYRDLAAALDSRRWAGDRDSLPEVPTPEEWGPVSAERNTCTVRACPNFNDCAYYQARGALSKADVIVANHDLLLASIGARILPDLGNCLIVLDEAHHLPAKAVEHFASSVDVTRLRWLDRLPTVMGAIASELPVDLGIHAPVIARELKTALADVGRMVWDLHASDMRENDGVHRLPEATVQGPLRPALLAIQGRAQALDLAAQTLASALLDRMHASGDDRSRWASHFAALGAFGPRLGAVTHLTELLLADDESGQRTAKWCSVEQPTAGTVALQLHASPILPGDLLALQLWHLVRGAVLTSASLTSCGSFSFFLGEAGLAADPAVHTRAVASPFDHHRQGLLLVRKTHAAVRDMRAFNAEVSQQLATHLSEVHSGALVLFTSRRHMHQTFDVLAPALQARVLMQGAQQTAKLLAAHRARITAGEPSILFGLQSFGEGLDLPGALCERLYICKLPFQRPGDPVAQARADYLNAAGRDAFAELVVPAAGVRMLQWTGRAIRTETDETVITCFDGRLVDATFGKRILAGLPSYRLEVLAPAAGDACPGRRQSGGDHEIRPGRVAPRPHPYLGR